jgi:Protein of unknown function (DUF3800)
MNNRYFLFLDESGDHGLDRVDPGFPIFTLCGILFNEQSFTELDKRFRQIKTAFWKNENVIFHSRNIRKCDREFAILLDYEIKSSFYKMLNQSIIDADFKIISVSVNKNEYKKRFGSASNLYSICLTLIAERCIFCLESFNNDHASVVFVAEKRGNKEDKELLRYFNIVLDQGTYYVKPKKFLAYNTKLTFRAKSTNNNGMQLSDLIAYPIARYFMNPEVPNPAFEIFSDKFYSFNGRKAGLKILP